MAHEAVRHPSPYCAQQRSACQLSGYITYKGVNKISRNTVFGEGAYDIAFIFNQLKHFNKQGLL